MEIRPMNPDISLDLKMLEKKMEVMLDSTLKKIQTLIMGLQTGIDRVSADIQQVQNRMTRLEDKAYERPSFDQNEYSVKAASEPAAQPFVQQVQQEHFSQPNNQQQFRQTMQQQPQQNNGFRNVQKSVPIVDATTGKQIPIAQDNDAPKPRYGDYTPSDVSVEKFFYFGSGAKR